VVQYTVETALIEHRFIEQTAHSSSFGWKKNDDPISYLL